MEWFVGGWQSVNQWGAGSLEILKALLIWQDGGETDIQTHTEVEEVVVSRKRKKKVSGSSAFNHTSHNAPVRLTEAEKIAKINNMKIKIYNYLFK